MNDCSDAYIIESETIACLKFLSHANNIAPDNESKIFVIFYHVILFESTNIMKTVKVGYFFDHIGKLTIHIIYYVFFNQNAPIIFFYVLLTFSVVFDILVKSRHTKKRRQKVLLELRIFFIRITTKLLARVLK